MTFSRPTIVKLPTGKMLMPSVVSHATNLVEHPQLVADRIRRYAAASTRSFCSQCGTPLLYERKSSPHMVNIPRALFTGRTGREPCYHVAIEELQGWAYTAKRLVPLKAYPGVVWERPKSRRRPHNIEELEFLDRRVPSARARIVQ